MGVRGGNEEGARPGRVSRRVRIGSRQDEATEKLGESLGKEDKDGWNGPRRRSEPRRIVRIGVSWLTSSSSLVFLFQERGPDKSGGLLRLVPLYFLPPISLCFLSPLPLCFLSPRPLCLLPHESEGEWVG